MIGISEAVCTNVQGALLVGDNEGVAKSGGSDTENLFAALLAALSGGLLVPQNGLGVVAQEVVRDAQIGVAVAGAGTVDTAASLPEGVALPLAQGCGEETGMASTDVALKDVAQAPVSVEMPGDGAGVPAGGDEILADVASVAGNNGTSAGAAGTGDDQATLASVQHGDRSAQVESSPGPDASSIQKLLAQVESSVQAEKASYAAAKGSEASARGSPAGAKAPAQGDKSAEMETSAQPVLSSEADEVPSSPGLAGVAAHFRGDDNVAMGPRQDAQPGGNDLTRGSGEKLLPENLLYSHGPGGQRAVNATENAVSPVLDVGKAHLTEPVIEQTVRGVLLSVREGASELRVRIQPEHLGELHLRMVFKDNVLSLDVNAQNTVVKSIIESNLGQLRQSLHSNGVDVGRVSVTVDPDVSSGGHFSREAPVFQPSEGQWAGTYRGDREEQKQPLEQWFRGARMRHAVNRLDLVA